MNNQTTTIITRAQTADEEFDYLIDIVNNLNFYNKYGYDISIPTKLLNIINNLNDENKKSSKKMFKKAIYSKSFFKEGLKTITKDIALTQHNVKEMNQWKTWGFKIFSYYEIKLTAYGPGGSYDFNHGNIVIKTRENGKFDINPQHTIIHEIVHIGIEESIVKKYKLTHLEKENVVDAICANHLDTTLIGYKTQNLENKKIFNLVAHCNIMELPNIIKKYKKNDIVNDVVS